MNINSRSSFLATLILSVISTFGVINYDFPGHFLVKSESEATLNLLADLQANDEAIVSAQKASLSSKVGVGNNGDNQLDDVLENNIIDLISIDDHNLTYRTTTNKDNIYSFSEPNIKPERYKIEQVTFRHKDRNTYSAGATHNVLASQITQVNSSTKAFELSTNSQQNTNNDSVKTPPPGSISGRFVLTKADKDAQDGTQSAQITLKLLNYQGQPVQRDSKPRVTQTAADGSYSFDGESPGAYKVQVDLSSLPKGFEVIGENPVNVTLAEDKGSANINFSYQKIADASAGEMDSEGNIKIPILLWIPAIVGCITGLASLGLMIWLVKYLQGEIKNLKRENNQQRRILEHLKFDIEKQLGADRRKAESSELNTDKNIGVLRQQIQTLDSELAQIKTYYLNIDQQENMPQSASQSYGMTGSGTGASLTDRTVYPTGYQNPYSASPSEAMRPTHLSLAEEVVERYNSGCLTNWADVKCIPVGLTQASIDGEIGTDGRPKLEFRREEGASFLIIVRGYETVLTPNPEAHRLVSELISSDVFITSGTSGEVKLQKAAQVASTSDGWVLVTPGEAAC